MAIIAIITTGVVGLLAPIINGLVGGWRQRKAQAHDREQQQRHIDAEEERRARDRRDHRRIARDHARRDALLAAIEAATAFGTAVDVARRTGAPITEQEDAPVRQIGTVRAKLMVFFEEGHEVITAFDRWMMAFMGLLGPEDGGEQEDDEITNERINKARKGFESAARPYVKSDEPPA